MKKVLALVAGALVLTGCGSTGTESPTQIQTPPKEMPSAVGITAGQSGTGATSGGSTGY